MLPFGVASVDGGQRIRGGRTHAAVTVAFCTHTHTHSELPGSGDYILGSGWEKCHQTTVT